MTNPTTNREFVVPLENKPGTLADVATSLGKANINIQGYLLEAQGDFGVFRFITNEPAKTEGWLKQTNRPYRANDVIVTPVATKPLEERREHPGHVPDREQRHRDRGGQRRERAQGPRRLSGPVAPPKG
jgi:hypothetical protein